VALSAALALWRRISDWWCEPLRTKKDLLVLARQIEKDQPNLAAELRFIAQHRPDDGEGRLSV
jgi:hypothetical protein